MTPLMTFGCGLIAGLHGACYGAWKDSPFESFRPRRFVRELLIASAASFWLIRVLGVVSPLPLILGAFALTRIVTEFYKLFFRSEEQTHYRIPTEAHFFKQVVASRPLRGLMGIGWILAAYGVYGLLKLLPNDVLLYWLQRGAFDIVQPDATKVGGISEQRRIAWMAQEFGVKYVGHGWNTALGVAADLQLAAALPHVDVVEFIGGSPYVDAVRDEGLAPQDAISFTLIADLPGEKIAGDSATQWSAPTDGTTLAIAATTAVARGGSGVWSTVSTVALIALVAWCLVAIAFILFVAKARRRRARSAPNTFRPRPLTRR